MAKAALSRADLLRAIKANSQTSLEPLSRPLSGFLYKPLSKPLSGPLPKQPLPEAIQNALGFYPEPLPENPTEVSMDEMGDARQKAVVTSSRVNPNKSGTETDDGYWRAVALQLETNESAEQNPTEQSDTIPLEMPKRDNPIIPEYHFLADFQQIIPRLHKLLSQLHPSRSYDMAKIVQRISQGETLSDLPRRYRPGWGGSLYILEDRSDYLAPYVRDQAMVYESLKSIYSDSGFFSVIYHENIPWPQQVVDDANSIELEPIPGDQILILSDLGSLAQDGGKASEFWLEFGHHMQCQGVNLIALIPCHPLECPTKLTPFYQLMSWEHPAPTLLSQSELEQKGQQLLTHLSPAARIEPGLLRDIRLELGENDYPARLESWVWQQLDQHNLLGAGFNPEKQAQYFQTFESEASLDNQSPNPVLTRHKKTLALTQQWMNRLPYELWLTTVIKLGDWAKQSQDPKTATAVISRKEQKDAQDFIDYLADCINSNGPNSFSARSWHWLEGFIDEADNGLDNRQKQQLQISLRTIKKAILQRHNGNHWQTTKTPDLQTYDLQYGDKQWHFIHPSEQGESVQTPTIAQIKTEDGFIQIEPDVFWLSGQSPSWAADWGQDKYGSWVIFEIQGYRQKMRWIPPGEFIMGAPEDEPGRYDDEGPQHCVIIYQGYWLFDTPVTQALWQVVMGENPSWFQSPQRPVETVGWNDAQTFIQILNQKMPGLVLSLPSEAQWEYACRAGTDTAIYSGTLEILGQRNAPALDNIAWYGGNSGVDFTLKNGHDISNWSEKQYPDTSQAGTHPVAQKQANPWGLYDMLGNVWEWTSDHWHNNYQGAPKNGEAWLDPEGQEQETRRVLRGGSWSFYASHCRSATRFADAPDLRDYGVGFRCACVQEIPVPEEVAEPGNCGGVSRAEPDSETRSNGRGAAAQLTLGVKNSILTPDLEPAQRLSICSDQQRLRLQKTQLPSWASAIGQDQYGLWAEFTVESDQKAVIQRLRWIPPGQFLMGASENEVGRQENEGPLHRVTITKGFWLLDTLVTQGLWETIMGQNPSYSKGKGHPVESVTWLVCQQFVKKLNAKIDGIQFSLPTEAQWEYACRAGTTTASFSANDENVEADYDFRFPFLGFGKSADLKQLAAQEIPNRWGLFHMQSHFWEWCLDGERAYTNQAITNPVGPIEPQTKKILRGGSWFGNKSICRPAERESLKPNTYHMIKQRRISFRLCGNE